MMYFMDGPKGIFNLYYGAQQHYIDF